MNEPAPLLSVVIPAWNREAGIARAIASVGVAPDTELIVVDDGSVDRTAEAAEAALAARGGAGRVIRQANGGPGAARNAGAEAASGRWLAFLDSDDSWFSWTLPRLLRILREAEAAGAPLPAQILLREREIRGETLPGPEAGVADADPAILHFPGAFEAYAGGTGVAFGSCNLVIRRDAFERIGGFTREIRYGEDNDLILRAAAEGPCLVAAAPVMVALTRGGDDHLTGNGAAARKGFAFLLEGARAGRYPDPADRAARDRTLADFARKLVRRHYEDGLTAGALAAWARHTGVLLRGDPASLVKLPLAPVFAALGMRNYRYVRRAGDRR